MPVGPAPKRRPSDQDSAAPAASAPDQPTPVKADRGRVDAVKACRPSGSLYQVPAMRVSRKELGAASETLKPKNTTETGVST